jgi:hypothetical protein
MEGKMAEIDWENKRSKVNRFYGALLLLVLLIIVGMVSLTYIYSDNISIVTRLDSVNYIIMSNYLYKTIISSLIFVFALLIVFRYYHTETLHVLKRYEEKRDSNWPEIERTIKSLNRSIVKFSTLGYVSLSVATLSLLILCAYVFNAFENVINDANKLQSSNIALVVVLVILRASVIGGLTITFLLKIMQFTNDSFDQAARFTKRKHGALFLLQMLEEDANKLDNERMTVVMGSFKEWNMNIESAYSKSTSDKSIATAFEKLGKVDELAKTVAKEAVEIIKKQLGRADASIPNVNPQEKIDPTIDKTGP